MLSSILLYSLSALIVAAIITVVAWVIILIVLRKINKYNIRTFWFWALSVLIIPFAFVLLSLILSAGKIQKKVVVKAQNYAVGLVATVNDAPVVDDFLPDNIVSSVIDKFPSLSYFLKNHKIAGDTDEELVSSVFAIANNSIDHFQQKTGNILIGSVLGFLVVVLLAGLLKNSRKKALIASNQSWKE